MHFQWENLSSSYKKKDNSEEYILNNVSGSAKSKSFTAILGPSGAGKTTLLEGMSCRSNNVQGRITLNGNFVTNKLIKEISGFLSQNDIFFEYLTAKEHLEFMSTMKLYNTLNSWERSMRVKRILLKFGLEKCSNTVISKLSGGEKRRLFLGTELLSDPVIIFCDEPTTGLDSYNALQIILLLKELSLNGKIVIVTIHQPSSDIIHYFDNFILLSLGYVILDGSSQIITSFFNRLNIFCPETCNIAEFYIKQISVIPGAEEECKQKINEYRLKFLQHTSFNYIDVKEDAETVDFKEYTKCPHYIQFFWLIWREYITMKRQFTTELLTFVVLLVTAIIIAVFYSSAEHNLSNKQDANGFLYLCVSELLFTATYSVLNTFPYEVPIFIKEKDLYSAVVYYTVKILSKIPQAIIYPYSFLFIFYMTVPFTKNIIIYITMGFIMSIASLSAMAYGFMFSAMFESVDYIHLITVPMDTLFLITAGIFLNVNTLPYILKWIKYISSFFYSYQAVTTLYWNSANEPDYSKNSTQIPNNEKLAHYSVDLYSLIILTAAMHVIGCLSIIRRKKTK